MGFVLFGLTGGLASGKSSVAARWRARGLPVIDADETAREVVAKGSPALVEVVQTFGAGVLLPDGSLDRKRVAAIVFSDPEARKKLEGITHPRIAAATLERAGELESQGEPLVCYEAALLVERGFVEWCRPLVVVAADERTQVARAVARDKFSVDEARSRIAAQLPLRDKVAAADYVIQNNGDLASLTKAADDVLDRICEQAGVDLLRYPKPKER